MRITKCEVEVHKYCVHIQYSVTSSPQNLATSLEMYADLLARPLFPIESLEREVEAVDNGDLHTTTFFDSSLRLTCDSLA
jgi:hypothetical protein